MERYENIIKIEEIRRLADDNEYVKALHVLDTIDVKRIKSLTDLSIIADVYTRNEEYDKAMAVLIKIYEKNKARRILYQLVDLSIKRGNTKDAEFYLNKYIKIAPKDSYRYIFRYCIDKLKDEPFEVLIDSLEQLKEYEYYEVWAYELAKLYHKAGMKDKCVRECSDIVLWFGEGIYVEKARLLKAYYVGEINPIQMLKVKDKKETEKRLGLDKTKDYSTIRSQIDRFLAENEEEASSKSNVIYSTNFVNHEENQEEELESYDEEEGQEEELEAYNDEEDQEELEAYNDEEGQEELEAYDNEEDQEEELEAYNEEEGQEYVVTQKETLENDNNVEDHYTTNKVNSEDDKDSLNNDSKNAYSSKTVERSAYEELMSFGVFDDYKDEDKTNELEEGLFNKHFEDSNHPADTLEKSDTLEETRNLENVEILENTTSMEHVEELIRNENNYLKKLFGYYICKKECNKQIMHSLERLVFKEGKGEHFIITGHKKSGKTNLGKGYAKFLYEQDFIKSPRVAKISAHKLNQMQLIKSIDKLLDGTLIIEEASMLSSDMLSQILHTIRLYDDRIYIILEDSKENMEQFLDKHESIHSVFENWIDIPRFTKEDLYGSALCYLEDSDYKLSHEGKNIILTAIDEIEKNATETERFQSVMEFMKRAKDSADNRYKDVLKNMAIAKEFDYDHLMYINEEDFCINTL